MARVSLRQDYETMPHRAGAMDIVLIGFMGAGKTTVGRALAARLNGDFTDLDDSICTATCLTVPQIFAQQGEHVFRALEAEHLRNWLRHVSERPRVLALGGGAVESTSVRTMLADSPATVFHLDAPLDALVSRCAAQDTPRPLLHQARERFARREPLYRELGAWIDTSQATPEAIAEHIASSLRVAA